MDIAKKFGLTHSLLSTVREVVAAERGVREYGVDQERRLVQKQRLMNSEQKKSGASSAPKKVMIAKGKTGGVQMIPKNKYNPKKHVLASGDSDALSPKQKKLDINKNNKLDATDFAMLRKDTKKESHAPDDDAAMARRRAISKVISKRVAQHTVRPDRFVRAPAIGKHAAVAPPAPGMAAWVASERRRLAATARERRRLAGSLRKESPSIKISGKKEMIQMKPKIN